MQVRLWDITSGSLLDTCEVGAKVCLLLKIIPEVHDGFITIFHSF